MNSQIDESMICKNGMWITGDKLCSKLTEGAAFPDKWSKMNVNFAKSVFSRKTLSEMIDGQHVPRCLLPGGDGQGQSPITDNAYSNDQEVEMNSDGGMI
jgi:hypothetical protein